MFSSLCATNPLVIEINNKSQYVKFQKGDTILSADDDIRFLHVIQSGLVKVYSLDSRGEQNITIIYGRDDLFPLAWVINQRRQNVFFEALSDVEIQLVPQDLFMHYLKSDAQFAFVVTTLVIEQYMLHASRVNNLEFKFGRERLAYRLLMLSARFGTKVKNTLVLPHITQQDLGATVNMTRESVSREMSRFERLGLVSYSPTNIVILDPEQLREELGKNVRVMFYDNDQKA